MALLDDTLTCALTEFLEGEAIWRGKDRPALPFAGDSLVPLSGNCGSMMHVKALARRAAGSECTVLVNGETGTGKGVCAKAIHHMSSRGHAPFVVVDGTLLHDELALSQLFGHAKGAFTGAGDALPGLVTGADGGTLFIDEIGDVSPKVQAGLLRLIDEKRFRRIGDTIWREVDCRVICATRHHLPERVRTGEFREDLLWRICCLEIALPPLRERGEDVLTLARDLLMALSKREGKALVLDADAETELRTHSWPGNIRELRQRLERAVVLAEDGVVTASDLGLPATGGQPAPYLKDLERRALLESLRRSAGNRRQAARFLGIPESTLRGKLHKHGIAFG